MFSFKAVRKNDKNLQTTSMPKWEPPFFESTSTNSYSSIVQGYPLPPDVPRPSNVSTGEYMYLSQLDLPTLRNEPIISIADRNLLSRIALSANCTGRLALTDRFTDETIILGTVVLISPTQALTARHCVEKRATQQLIIIMDANFNDQYPVVSRQDDQEGLDITLLTVSGRPGDTNGYAKIKMEEQPAGRHFMIHYAGGKIKQISTGDFVVNEYYQSEHNIFADAGTLASGCGIFDCEGALIGINVYRTSELMALSRKPILLSDTKLFNANPFNFISADSVLRPYTAPAKRHHSFTTYSLAPTPPYASAIPHFGFSDIFSSPSELLFQDDYEGIKNAIQLLEIHNFLLYVKDCVKRKVHADPTNIPSSLLSQKQILEEHQKVHVLKTRPRGKSYFSEYIAMSVDNPILKALAIALHKIASEFYFRHEVDSKLEPGSNFVIDLGFTIGTNDNGQPATEIMLEKAYSKGDGKFHVYPVDTSLLRTNHEKVYWPNFSMEIAKLHNVPIAKPQQAPRYGF